MAESDSLKRFPIFEYPCLPLIGVYGEDYTPSDVLLLTQIIDAKFNSIFPSPIVQALADFSYEFWVIIQDTPKFGPCQHIMCDKSNEFNLMLHFWVFGEDFNFGKDYSETASTGIFQPKGIKTAHLDLNDVKSRGMSFNSLSERSIIVHNGGAFSPCNCQVEVTGEVGGFFSVTTFQSRAIVCYHILPFTNDSSKLLREEINSADDLKDLSYIGSRSDKFQSTQDIIREICNHTKNHKTHIKLK